MVRCSVQASSGLLADGRHLANRARDEVASLFSMWRSPPTVQVKYLRLACTSYRSHFASPKSLVDRVGLYVQAYTLYSSVRPFGCSTIIGGIDKTGPALFVIEPSGVSYVRTSFTVVKQRLIIAVRRASTVQQ